MTGGAKARYTLNARKFINLGRLPIWLQNTIALGVVAVVVALAWFVGRDRAVPAWVSDGLVPILGWIAIGVIVLALAVRLGRRR